MATVLQRLSDAEASCLSIVLPGDLPMALLDEVQIEQVLWNLLENAYKYTPPDSPVTLQAAAREGCLKITGRPRAGYPARRRGTHFR
ncbi:MAG: hypothetical protein IT210_20825 [Armatimonadetes bacterium]|nr:hypothetical protein [Armatimonadota bacterium]